MTGTLNSACPLCGLRFASRPLLELHIREDHRQRDPRAQPDRGTKEVTAMTVIRHPRASRLKGIPRRTIRALRYVNDELVRAVEAIFRPARAARSRQPAEAPANGHPRSDIPAEHADRAA